MFAELLLLVFLSQRGRIKQPSEDSSPDLKKQKQTASKILGTHELWVDFCAREMNPGSFAHHVVDINLVLHVCVVLEK